MKNKDCNGYKVCYREKNRKQYIRYFMTYTFKQAKYAMTSYIRYPPRAREDNHKLYYPTWKIIPISHKEVQDGIWRENPF